MKTEFHDVNMTSSINREREQILIEKNYIFHLQIY